MRLTRRSLLAAGTLGVGVSPLVSMLAGALAAPPPQASASFVGIFMPHGMALELWRPRANFDIGYPDSSLAPFDDAVAFGKSFRDRLLVIEGIDLTAGMRGGSAGHEGSRALLTGSAFE